MEEGEDSCIKNTVELSPRCDKSYKKLSKKADPNLLKAINESIDELEENSELGKKLTQDLKGMRSIRLNPFRYRIVYEVQEGSPSKKIIVYTIAHRNKAYSELEKYFGVGHYAESDE